MTELEQQEDINVWLGETGWPVTVPASLLADTGLPYPGIPGKASLQKYWNSIICSEDFQSRNSFFYVDYDDGEPADRPMWGVFNQTGDPRITLQCGPV